MTPTNPTPVKPADIKPGMKVRMLPNWWEKMPKCMVGYFAHNRCNAEFAPNSIHLVCHGPDGDGDYKLFDNPNGLGQGGKSWVHPSCFEVIPETPSQIEDLSTWPATRGPEWRRMEPKEVLDIDDVGLGVITKTWQYPCGKGGWIGRTVEDAEENDGLAEAWTKRPAPTHEKPPEPAKPSPKPPKPTRTELDLAEARKRVKALEDLAKVEAQIKAHKAAGADLRAKRDALKADIYYTRPWAKQAKAVAKKDKKKS